jgi:hypothetical protein
MASSNAANFNFQADVFSAASIAHLLTGRVLQALSNTRLDPRSLAAVLWLGKQIPVLQAHESSVHKMLGSRRDANTIIARVLNIGWGHTDLAVELALTKAGVSSLLLISALATGSSIHSAAQCLSELLCLSGLESDSVPSIEVLKSMISYLAPPMRDLGFPRVTALIIATAEHNCFTELRKSRPPDGLASSGDASVLAGAIRQLCLTSRLGETVYFITKQRGAWLAAFASHVLGMEVDVLYGSTTVWGSGGAHGKAVFQLDEAYEGSPARPSEISTIPDPRRHQGNRPITINYSMHNALESGLARYSDLEAPLISAVSNAIVRLSFAIRDQMARSIYPDDSASTIPICSFTVSRHFQSTEALAETLSHFGIHNARAVLATAGARQTFPSHLNATGKTEENGLRFFPPPELRRLQSICPIHQDPNSLPAGESSCYCQAVGRLVHGIATSAVALMQFSYDPSHIQLRSDITNGSVRTS